MSLDDMVENRSSRNHNSRCSYLLIQIKMLDKGEWGKLNNEFQDVDEDDTWEFSERLLTVYNELKAKKSKSSKTGKTKKKK